MGVWKHGLRLLWFHYDILWNNNNIYLNHVCCRQIYTSRVLLFRRKIAKTFQHSVYNCKLFGFTNFVYLSSDWLESVHIWRCWNCMRTWLDRRKYLRKSLLNNVNHDGICISSCGHDLLFYQNFYQGQLYLNIFLLKFMNFISDYITVLLQLFHVNLFTNWMACCIGFLGYVLHLVAFIVTFSNSSAVSLHILQHPYHYIYYNTY